MREFFESPAGKGIAIVVILLGLAAAVYSLRGMGSPAAAISNDNRVFVDSTTGKSFTLDLKPGMPIPVRAPSGGNTGYPAELCFWTTDGKSKDTPDAVLMNSQIGKSGPTFCPVCHRLVVGHNPRPGPGIQPPPTEAEYKTNKNHEEER